MFHKTELWFLMNKERKKSIVAMIFISLFVISFFVVSPITIGSSVTIKPRPYANLVFKTYGGGRWADVSLLIAQYLRDINIDVEIKNHIIIIEVYLAFIGMP